MSIDGPDAPRSQLAKTGPFICDHCKMPIENTVYAWGEWYGRDSTTREDTEFNWNFRIVHREVGLKSCCLPENLTWSRGHFQLDDLLSADGFSYLLEFFVSREVDPVEFSRFLMRLYLPGYEAAHRFINAAMAEEIFVPACHEAFLTQVQIANILDAKEQGRFEAYE